MAQVEDTLPADDRETGVDQVSPGVCTVRDIYKIRHILQQRYSEILQSIQLEQEHPLSERQISIRDRMRVLQSLQEVQTTFSKVLGLASEGALQAERQVSLDEMLCELSHLVLPNEVRQLIMDTLEDLELEPSRSYVSRSIEHQYAYQALHDCKCEMNGEVFVDCMFRQKSGHDSLSKSKVVDGRLTDLCHEVSEVFPEQKRRYIPIVHLLYHALGKDIITLTMLVQSQCDLMREIRLKQSEKVAVEPIAFFEHAAQFIGAYADISVEVFDGEEQFDKHMLRCYQVLSGILRSASRLHPAVISPDSETNLYTLTTELIRQHKDPWVVSDLSETMLHHDRVELLLSHEIHRKVVAGILRTLNNARRQRQLEQQRRIVAEYKPLVLSERKLQRLEQQADALLRELKLLEETSEEEFDLDDEDTEETREMTNLLDRYYEISFFHHESDDDANDFTAQAHRDDALDGRVELKEEEKTTEHTTKDAVMAEVDPMTEAYQHDMDVMSKVSANADLAIKVAFLSLQDISAQAEDPYQEITMATGKPVSPDHVLLRLIHPEKITQGDAALNEFKALITRIRTKFTAMQESGCDEASDYTILARSIQIVLYSGDPCLRKNLKGLNGRSIFDELANIAFDYFNEDVLCQGPVVLRDRRRDARKPIVPMVDRESLDESSCPVEKNFDVAAGGPKCMARIDAVKVAGIDEEGTNEYRKAELRAAREADRYFHGGGRFGYFFFNSATHAVEQFFLQAYPRLRQRDHLLIFPQQYAQMLSHFSEGRQYGVRAIQTHVRDGVAQRVPKPLDVLVGDTVAKVQPSYTQLLLASSLNRFGGSPCSYGEKRNVYWLAEWITDVRDQLFRASGLHGFLEMDAVTSHVDHVLRSHADSALRSPHIDEDREAHKQCSVLRQRMQKARFESMRRDMKKIIDILRDVEKQCTKTKKKGTSAQARQCAVLRSRLVEAAKLPDYFCLHSALAVIQEVGEIPGMHRYKDELVAIVELKMRMQRVRYYPGANDTEILKDITQHVGRMHELAGKHNLAEWMYDVRGRIGKCIPYVPFMNDACQAFGSREPDYFNILAPDACVWTGSKAGFCGRTAGIALDKEYEDWLKECGKRVALTTPYVDEGNLGAMAMTMSALGGCNDYTRLDGNIGKNRKLPLDKKIANHQRMLTEHTVHLAQQFGAAFCTRCLGDKYKRLVGVRGINKMASIQHWEDIFSCQWVEPADSIRDYGGIVTLHFRAINGRKLQTELRKRGIRVGVGLRSDRAIRLKLCYPHDTEHIDDLFTCIMEILNEEVDDCIANGRDLSYSKDVLAA